MEVAGQPLARLALRTRTCEKFDTGEDDKCGGKCVFAGDQPLCRYEVEPVDSVLEREGNLVGVGEVEMSDRIVGGEEERIADSHRGIAPRTLGGVLPYARFDLLDQVGNSSAF